MVRFSNIIMNGIKMLLNNKNLSTTCNFMLEKILNDTESKMGIIGKVVYDNDGIATIYPLGITNIGWTQGLASNIKNISFKLYHDTLLHAPIKYKKTILTNDPSNHPMSNGTPKGHPNINSYIATPILDNDKIIGYIGLANKKGGYDDTFIESFERLARMLSFILLFYSDNVINNSNYLVNNDLLLNILNNCRDGIFIVNKFKKIIAYNEIINNIFNISKSTNLNSTNITDIFPHLDMYFNSISINIVKIVIVQVEKILHLL